MTPVLLFDFDSTLIRDEGLDTLYLRSLEGAPDRDERTRAFQELTDRGMAGELPFEDALARRLELLVADRSLVEAVGAELASRLSPSVLRHRSFFQERGGGTGAGGIHVLSGGFRELIEPAAAELGIVPSRVHAHRFRYGVGGQILGLDPETALARGGKPQAVRDLGLDPSRTWVVGDGATDLELRELGLVSSFIAFVENRSRAEVVARADRVVGSMEELLELLEKAAS
jgi:D-3-phosphoglycerate dehydrogenase / 2-oxoglutarate reductase